MGFPMAEAYLFFEISTESHEMAQMAPSSLFIIASFGGLFACVVLCLICSECYSRYRNRRVYHGITQSSSGEHELPTTVPRSLGNLQSKACAIPTPPPSYDEEEVEREMDRRTLIHERQLQSRGLHLSTIIRIPSYDQVVSELDRRTISHAHQPRSRRISGSTITRSPSHDQVVSEVDHQAMSLHQPRSRRTSGSTARTKPTRSTSFEVLIEPGQHATPYPHESERQAIQVEDLEPTTSSGNQYPVRVIDTPPQLFEQVAKESTQYGLPIPMPTCQTMPRIYKKVRRAVHAEDSEPIPSHRSLQSAAQATPTPSPPIDQAVSESDRREMLHVHRSQSDRTHQSVGAVLTRSPSFDQVIQPARRATPDVHHSVRQVSQAVHPASSAVHPASSAVHPASSAVHPASSAVHPASSTVHPASPADIAEILLAQISDQNENSLSDYDRYSVLTNSGQCESFEDSYMRRMYALELGLHLLGDTPPPEYLSVLPTPPPSYADVMIRDPFESPPIQYSPTWARYRPAFLRIESPPSTQSPHFSEEDPLEFHMSTSSKSNEAEAKSDIESSTEAKGAVGGTRSKSTKPETKGAMARTKAEEALLQAKIAATWAMLEEAKLKMTDETTEFERAIPEMKDAASRTEAELPMPKTEGAMPSTESKYALPKTKGRPAPAGTETEWAHSKQRGATARTEVECDMPKTDDAVVSTETELPTPKTKSSRTREYREWVTLKTKGTTATIESGWVFPKPEGETAAIETDRVFPKPEGVTAAIETDRVFPKAEGATDTIKSDWVFSKPEGATARIDTEWPMPEIEGATARTETDWERSKIEGAEMRAEAEGTIAKSKDRRFRDMMESSDSTGDLDIVPISTDFYATGGARPKVLTKSAKKKKSKSKRKNKKSRDKDY